METIMEDLRKKLADAQMESVLKAEALEAERIMMGAELRKMSKEIQVREHG